MASGLAKTLLSREVLALACGAMIGWSWVLLTGEWLSRAGTMGTVIAFMIGSSIVILISLAYAELASAMPLAGGEHHYTKAGTGLHLIVYRELGGCDRLCHGLRL